MKKNFDGLINYLFFCGLPHKDYNEVRPILWARNRRILRITSILSAILGSILLIVYAIKQTGSLLPYIFLTTGSIVIYLVVMIFGRRFKNAYFSFAVCYGQMVLTIIYAVLLSIDPANAAIPATSVIVFIALLPA